MQPYFSYRTCSKQYPLSALNLHLYNPTKYWRLLKCSQQRSGFNKIHLSSCYLMNLCRRGMPKHYVNCSRTEPGMLILADYMQKNLDKLTMSYRFSWKRTALFLRFWCVSQIVLSKKNNLLDRGRRFV